MNSHWWLCDKEKYLALIFIKPKKSLHFPTPEAQKTGDNIFVSITKTKVSESWVIMLLTRGIDNTHCYVARVGLLYNPVGAWDLSMFKLDVRTVPAATWKGTSKGCAQVRSDRSGPWLHFAFDYVCHFSQNHISPTHQINTLNKLKPKVSSSSYGL